MSTSPARAEFRSDGTAAPLAGQAAHVALRCRELATAIHDGALQSIALCLLQTELAKRLWERGEPTRALGELQAITPELEAAAEMLRHVITELLALADAPEHRC
ncbi:MAG TPA: histidine kinase [Chloroflexota bacterium]|jgi:signal transduction histidine kinase|nr:histidine kinase [Chloroflexota bacterium]